MITVEVIDHLNVHNGDCNDFIYNRFDLIYHEFIYLKISADTNVYVIPVHIEKEHALFGLWLSSIPLNVLKTAIKYIFRKYKHVIEIRFSYCLTYPDGLLNSTVKRNHWSISLPDTIEDLDSRLSRKKRYNIKREKRLAEEKIGHYIIKHYNAKNVPENLIETYFMFKKTGYGIDYHMTAKEYIQKYFVSDVYVLTFPELNRIGSIIFSCEQGENVYLENLSYDPEFKQYSLGAILYDIYLKELVIKKKKSLYLGYGDYIYKSLYGGQENITYNSTVYRNLLIHGKKELVPRYYKKIRHLIRKMIIR